MSKKGVIGLSVNLIVIIIISLVILGSGLTLLYKLIGGAEETKALLDTRTEAELERLLIDQGKKVALPRHTSTVYAGQTQVFGLGILNIDESRFGRQFTLTVALSKFLDLQGNEISPSPDVSSWLRYNQGSLTIEENQHHTEPILVKIPKDAKKGAYIFNVQVSCTGSGPCDPYDNIKKFTINVK